MKKKKKCIICQGKKFRRVDRVDGVKFYECTQCFLAIHEGVSTHNQKKNTYEERKYSAKFREISTVIRNFVREGKVLETGPGYGIYASNFIEKKFKKDTSKQNLKYIYLSNEKYKVRIIQGDYEKFLNKNKERFDLITFIGNFSAFRRPDLLLARTRQSLLDQGLVLILIPNYKSLMNGLSRKWSFWKPQSNKYHFSPDSIKKMLHNEKYKVKYFTTFETWRDMRRSLDNNFSNIHDAKKRIPLKTIFYILFIPIYFLFRRLIWSMGYGAELCVIASKS